MKTITFKINDDYIKAEPVLNDNMKGFNMVEPLKSYSVDIDNINHYACFDLIKRDDEYYIMAYLVNQNGTAYKMLYRLSYSFQADVDLYSFMGNVTKLIDMYLSLYLFHKAGYKVVKCNDTIKQVA